MRKMISFWLCAGWFALSPLLAHSDPPPVPNLTVPQPPIVFSENAPAPHLVPPVAEEFFSPALPQPPLAATYDDSRFWIVSSRDCPQSRKNLGCCGFDYFSVSCNTCGTNGCGEMLTVTPIDGGQFSSELVPGIPVCMVVHGSFVDWQTVHEYGCRIYRWLRCANPGQPVQMVFYTWPSESITHIPQIDVNVLGLRSARNGLYLSSVLARVPVESPVCLLGHSHGTRTIAALLHSLAGGEVEGMCLPPGSDRGHRIRTVFAASALDHDWLNPGDLYGRALYRTESLLILLNRKDLSLTLYPLRKPFGSRALSHTGLTNGDQRRLGGLVQRVCEVDVAPLVGKYHTWPNYYSRPEIATTMMNYVYYSDELASVADPVPTATTVQLVP